MVPLQQTLFFEHRDEFDRTFFVVNVAGIFRANFKLTPLGIVGPSFRGSAIPIVAMIRVQAVAEKIDLMFSIGAEPRAHQRLRRGSGLRAAQDGTTADSEWLSRAAMT
jgi:hypothetical protein